jgi:hypothetical protein
MVKIPLASALRSFLRPEHARVEVYGDETLSRGAYDILGALWISADEAAKLQVEIQELRVLHGGINPGMELKWKKCGGTTPHPLYDAVIDLVMGRIMGKRMAFKCLVIERALVDNKAWNDGDAELGFFKAWHTLLRSWLRPKRTFDVRLDALELQRAGRLDDLRNVLNACGMKDLGIDYWCCGSVEARDSKAEDLIQVVDLLIGAVGYHWSGGHLANGASQRKMQLAERIARHLGKRSLKFESKSWEKRFNVWRYIPSKPKTVKTQRAP